jgi:putative ABC transport system permease protein
VSALSRLTALARNLFHRSRVERELAEELATALDELARENEAAGLAPEAARRAAALELGGVESIKQQVREVRAGVLLDQLGQDLVYALRMLRRSPLFAAIAVLTLGLGIGANVAFFSLARAALAAPLPYPEPERLVHVWAYWTGGWGNFSYPDFEAIESQDGSFDAVAAYESWGRVALSGIERPVQVHPSFVTARYLELLGAKPVLGRVFDADDARRAAPLAVLSHEMWQRHFAGDPGVLGRTLRLNGTAYSVAGVLAPDFKDLGLVEGPAPDLWLPVGAAQPLLGQAPLASPYRIYFGLARLKPGATLAQARDGLAAVAAHMERERPASHRGYGLTCQPLRERIAGGLRAPGWLLSGGAGLVLLIACANIAGALIARLAARRRELALRAALGATASRLFRQLLLESALLATLGGVAGLACALLLTRAAAGWLRSHVSPLVQVRVDAVALAWAALLTLGCALLFGTLPALRGRRADLREMLGARGGALPQRRAQRSLIAAEAALSVVLLVGAGLMLDSLRRLTERNVGYRSDHLLTFGVGLTGGRYAEPAARRTIATRLLEGLRAIPGVRSATLMGPSLLGNATWVMEGFPEEETPRGPEDFVMLFRHNVNPGALGNLGIPLLKGRDFDEHDGPDAPRVAIVSASAARRFWGDADPVGRRLRRQDASRPALLVIGVAADAQHRDRYALGDIAGGLPPAGAGPQLDIYLPYLQQPHADMTFALRLAVAPAAALESAQRTLAEIDAELAIGDARMLDERLAEQESSAAALAALLAGYAAFALFLASLGLYGLVSQVMAQRRYEIGIRLALGARPRDVIRELMRGALGPALAGALAGLAASPLVGRSMALLLLDTHSGVAAPLLLTLLLSAVATVACYLPARRVTGIDPALALRAE